MTVRMTQEEPALLGLLPPLHLPAEHHPTLKGESKEIIDRGGQGEDDEALDRVAHLDDGGNDDEDSVVHLNVIIIGVVPICVHISQDLEGEGCANKDIGHGQRHHEKVGSLKKYVF